MPCHVVQLEVVPDETQPKGQPPARGPSLVLPPRAGDAAPLSDLRNRWLARDVPRSLGSPRPSLGRRGQDAQLFDGALAGQIGHVVREVPTETFEGLGEGGHGRAIRAYEHERQAFPRTRSSCCSMLRLTRSWKDTEREQPFETVPSACANVSHATTERTPHDMLGRDAGTYLRDSPDLGRLHPEGRPPPRRAARDDVRSWQEGAGDRRTFAWR
jgi:hypothetical protein